MIIAPLSQSTLPAAIALADKVFPQQPLLEKASWAFRLSIMPGVLKSFILTAVEVRQVRYWVALEGEVVGVTGLFTRWSDFQEAAWLGWTCVAPQHRGQGIGGKLLDLAIDEARVMDTRYLRLITSTNPSMQVAQLLYESRGLRVVSRRNANSLEILTRQMDLRDRIFISTMQHDVHESC